MIDVRKYEQLMNSPEFMSLYRHVSHSNARFSELPETERKIALAIMMAGDEKVVNGLNDILYSRPMPTWEEFVTDTKWLGRGGEDIFKYWKSELSELFSPSNNYFEGVWTGGIGIGKSMTARLAQMYNATRVNCLREPQITLNQTKETVLGIMMMTINLEKGWRTLSQPLYEMLRTSQGYIEVKKPTDFMDLKESPRIPFCKVGDAIEFPNNIVIMIGSTNAHALGMTLIGGLLDEAEFRAGSVDGTLDLYTQLKERVRSRMLNQASGVMPRFCMLGLISSSKTQNGVIHNYIKDLPKNDQYTRVMGAPIWEVKDVDPYGKGHFYVMRGTQSNPSKILDLEHDEIENGTFEAPANCKVIKVPEIYRRDFTSRIEKALQNLAGEQTISDDQPFDNLDHMETEHLEPEFNIIAPLGSKIRLLDRLPKSLFKSTPDGMKFARFPNAMRYIHLDLAETSEAGFSVVHKELSDDGEEMVIADICAWITSPTRIDLLAIQNLVFDLSEHRGMILGKLTSDQYQSSQLRQAAQLKYGDKRVGYRSVDRTADAYLQLASMTVSGLFKTGVAPKLKAQLSNISVEGNKVFTRERKDIADSCAGASANALEDLMHKPHYKFSDGNNIQKVKSKSFENLDEI